MHITPRQVHSNGQLIPLTQVKWERLLMQHERWLRQIILARVGEPQAIDEVFQEVAAHALAQKSPLLDEAKAPAWLYRVAVTQCLLYRRKAGRQRKLLRRFGEDRLHIATDTADALHWLLSAERHEQVRAAMLCLPVQDAELLLLKYAEGWRYQQMANHLGLSVTVVEARLHRARARLRQLLHEKETP
jgi:RNA polymerase sigma factor (sigma-70 family)